MWLVVLFLTFWRNCVLVFIAATPFCFLINRSIVDPWTTWGWGPTLIENLPVTLQLAFLSVVHIHGFKQPQIMYYYSTYLLRKKNHVLGHLCRSNYCCSWINCILYVKGYYVHLVQKCFAFAAPRPRSGMVAGRSYPTSKVRSSGCAFLEQLWRDTSHPR